MTNNQPQVWISGHKLLVFLGDTRYNLHNYLLNVNFLFIMYFISLYLMFNYFHWLIMLFYNKLLIYLLNVPVGYVGL